MTTASPETTSKVTCACGAVVEPTRPGGTRPRPHLVPDTATACEQFHPVEAQCKRCGGTAPAPVGGCTSHLFHPQQWRLDDGTRVGNAAAAGSLIGVSGEYFLYIPRRYPDKTPGQGSRPPEPSGYDMRRRCRYWDLDAVAAWAKQRPGKGATAG